MTHAETKKRDHQLIRREREFGRFETCGMAICRRGRAEVEAVRYPHRGTE